MLKLREEVIELQVRSVVTNLLFINIPDNSSAEETTAVLTDFIKQNNIVQAQNETFELVDVITW